MVLISLVEDIAGAPEIVLLCSERSAIIQLDEGVSRSLSESRSKVENPKFTNRILTFGRIFIET